MTDIMITRREEIQDQYIHELLDDMDLKTMYACLYDFLSDEYDKNTDEELTEEVKLYYPHILEESNTNWGGRRWTIHKVSHKMGTDPKTVYCRHMNKNINDDNLLELQGYMCDTMASSEMALDWFCDRFNCDATDEIIDFVLDAHFAFFGEWQLT